MLNVIFLIILLIIIPYCNPSKNLFLNLLVVFCLLILTIKIIIEKRSEQYDYDAENPNALIQGRNIAGTVYSSNVSNTPGLGWIL